MGDFPQPKFNKVEGLDGLAAREAAGHYFSPTKVKHVRVVDSMGSDLSVVNAARVSFNKRKESIDTRDTKLIEYLLKHEHTSPFRHGFITFHVRAPIFVLRQWGKHQVGCSWNEVSMRYVKHDFGFWSPDSWRSAPEGNVKQGSGGPITNQSDANTIYDKAIESCEEAYNALLDAGVCREQARAILPQSMLTEFWWTASLQAVLRFLDLRLAKDSQSEIRAYAEEVEAHVKKIFPETLKAWRYVQQNTDHE